MEQNIKSLCDSLLQSVREYGIKDVSMGQYETVCRKIINFASEKGVGKYYHGLQDDFNASVDLNVKNNAICLEYARFQHRVMKMPASLAECGVVGFSCKKHRPRKYGASENSANIINDALGYHGLEGETRVEMSTVLRHFLKFVEEKTDQEKLCITDELLMEFFTKELPNTNKGSMGRALRAIKYLSLYLKSSGEAGLKLGFTQLNAHGSHIRIIPPYSQENICRAISPIDTDTPEGLRDYAILLLAFGTGLRGVGIRTLQLGDIGWYNRKIYLRQKKTNGPLVLPLSGKVMNAMADYILNGRPGPEIKEVFLTVKGPVKAPNKRAYGFTSLSGKYFNNASVDKIAGRGFHSIRRSFATELSGAGVPLETIPQLLGHKSTEESRPYLSYNREQAASCSMGFNEIPPRHSIYAGGGQSGNK